MTAARIVGILLNTREIFDVLTYKSDARTRYSVQVSRDKITALHLTDTHAHRHQFTLWRHASVQKSHAKIYSNTYVFTRCRNMRQMLTRFGTKNVCTRNSRHGDDSNRTRNQHGRNSTNNIRTTRTNTTDTNTRPTSMAFESELSTTTTSNALGRVA